MTDVQARKLTTPSAARIYGAAPLQPDAAVLDWTPPDVHRQRKNLVPTTAHPPTSSDTFRIKPLGKTVFLFVFPLLVFLQLQN